MKILLLMVSAFVLFSCSPPYKRSLYKHWIDKDRDCQNTRAELLIRDSLDRVKFKRVSGFFAKSAADKGRGHVFYPTGKKVKKPCNITFGKWYDPYSDKVFTKSSDVQIDHIIPLKHAHVHGAHAWNKSLKRTFANDFENLLIVQGKLNQSKSAKAPHEWMPPNKKYWCDYLLKWNRLKKKYRLDFSSEEKEFIKRILVTC